MEAIPTFSFHLRASLPATKEAVGIGGISPDTAISRLLKDVSTCMDKQAHLWMGQPLSPSKIGVMRLQCNVMINCTLAGMLEKAVE
ncbi:hypothetical protein P7K49_004500, partial [Saguinus oedipus]